MLNFSLLFLNNTTMTGTSSLLYFLRRKKLIKPDVLNIIVSLNYFAWAAFELVHSMFVWLPGLGLVGYIYIYTALWARVITDMRGEPVLWTQAGLAIYLKHYIYKYTSISRSTLIVFWAAPEQESCNAVCIQTSSLSILALSVSNFLSTISKQTLAVTAHLSIKTNQRKT